MVEAVRQVPRLNPAADNADTSLSPHSALTPPCLVAISRGVLRVNGPDEEVGCIHFPDDPNANCSLCKKKPGVDVWDTIEVGVSGSTVAMYYGTCVECGGSIYEGDLIQSGGGGWRHENCRG